MLLFRLHNVHLIWYEVSFSTDISVQERLVAKHMKKNRKIRHKRSHLEKGGPGQVTREKRSGNGKAMTPVGTKKIQAILHNGKNKGSY